VNAANTQRRARRRLRRFIALASALIVGLIALTAAISSAGDKPMLAQWAPGGADNEATIGGVEVGNPSPRLAEIVSVTTSGLGGDESAALKSLRLLRGGLGVGKVSLYAFSPDAAGLCLLVWDRSVACPTAESSSTPGVLWVLDGGYRSDVAGSPGDAPPAVAGLVSDGVRAVTVVVDGVSIPLELTSNTFFRELPSSGGDESTSAAVGLRVTYDDGSTAVASIN